MTLVLCGGTALKYESRARARLSIELSIISILLASILIFISASLPSLTNTPGLEIFPDASSFINRLNYFFQSIIQIYVTFLRMLL